MTVEAVAVGELEGEGAFGVFFAEGSDGDGARLELQVALEFDE